MALLGIIRRWHLRDKVPLREIAKRLGISRNTVRRYLRSETTEPAYAERQTASAIDPYAHQLAGWLKTEAAKSRKQRRSLKQLHEELVDLGFKGSYDRVAAFARQWREGQTEWVNSARKRTVLALSSAIVICYLYLGATFLRFSINPHGLLLDKTIISLQINRKYLPRLAAFNIQELKEVLYVYRHETDTLERRVFMLCGQILALGLFPAIAGAIALWGPLHQATFLSDWWPYLAPMILFFQVLGLRISSLRQKTDGVVAAMEYFIQSKQSASLAAQPEVSPLSSAPAKQLTGNAAG